MKRYVIKLDSLRDCWYYYPTTETLKELQSQGFDKTREIFDTEVEAIGGCISMHKYQIDRHRKKVEGLYDKICWLRGVETEPKCEDLYFNLSHATVLLKRRVLEAFSEYGVSPEWWDILQHMDGRSGTTQRELIKLTLKDKANISRILARMMRDGWVERRMWDNRSGAYFLSTKGANVCERLPGVLRNLTNDCLASFKPEERNELLSALKRLQVD